MDEHGKSKRSRKIIAALILACIGLVAGLLWFTGRSGKDEDDE